MVQHFGSVHYFSPEHAKGGITDAKSDVYSLGVVMYEMLTGKVPFDADTPVSVALKHMQEEPIPPMELNERIPVAINNIILKALKKDTRFRYQSATQMLEDLKKAQKNPDEDFVDELDDDPTARTQILKTATVKNTSRNTQKENDKPKGLKGFIKNHKKLAVIILILLILILSGVGTVLYLNSQIPTDVEIIDIVNLEEDEARKLIEELGLVFEIESEEYSDEIEAGYIISQDPEYSEDYGTVKTGSTVKVIISKGQEMVVMPKVIGLTEEEATKALEEIGLVAEVTEETSQTVEQGVVISQAIPTDEEILKGETVQIIVSSGTGIKQVTVLSVVGSTEEEAKSTLEGLGLVVNVNYTQDTSKVNGVVTSQSISKNVIVDEGTSITLTVNQFNETISVPVSINVKSLTGGYSESTGSSDDEDSNTLTDADKKVSITITVNGSEYTTKSNIDKNNTAYTTTISAEDTSSITVVITIKNSSGSVLSTDTINTVVDEYASIVLE